MKIYPECIRCIKALKYGLNNNECKKCGIKKKYEMSLIEKIFGSYSKHYKN